MIEEEKSNIFIQRLKILENRILSTCSKTNVKRENIKILAVSKKKTSKDIEVAISQGLFSFGENYLSEALEKIDRLSVRKNFSTLLDWHFIGQIQRNKTKKIAENFDWVHSIEKFEIAQRLSNQRPVYLKPLNVFIQVNIDQEESKGGTSIEDAKSLVIKISKLPQISVKGLMAIPKSTNDFAKQKCSFAKLKQTKDEINKSSKLDVKLGHLSMGMSNDLEAAISETDKFTKTWIRIGTSIFGERK